MKLRPRPLPFVRFCTEVLHLALSAPWRVLLLVAIDGVQPAALEGADRELARQIFGDVNDVPEAARKILVWRLGRGSGKTTISSALGLWSMWTADLRTCGVGTLPAACVVSPTKTTAGIAVRVGRELVRQSSLERYVVKKSDSAEGFHLRRPDGRIVAFRCVAASRGGQTLRGFDIIVLILDESEFFASNSDAAAGDGYAVSDRDLLSAAIPRLLACAVFISTPWPSENLTAQLFDENHGRPKSALAALGASTTMRPDDEKLAKDVAREVERDDENAQREYFCVSGLRGGRNIFVEGLEGAIDENRPLVIPAPPGALVGAGGDLGLERDSSAIAFAARLGEDYELLEFDEIRPSKEAALAPSYVIRDRFAPAMKRYEVRSIAMDAHYRQSAIEHLTACKLEFVDAPTGQQGKYDVYMHTRGLLRAGKLRIPNTPRLIAQMKAVVATPQPGGGTKISSPRRAGQGGHGDIVSALVLGIWAAKEGVPYKPIYVPSRATAAADAHHRFWAPFSGDPRTARLRGSRGRGF